MNNSAYIDLFESIRQTVADVSLDDFSDASAHGKLAQFQFWGAVHNTPLAPAWDNLNNWKTTASDPAMPRSMRELAYRDIKYKIDEILGNLRSGTMSVPRRRIDSVVVNKIADPKIRKICNEINATPDGNVISLLQLIGEALKWSLWYKAKQNHTQLHENGSLQALLNESIAQKYFTSNAATRFLKDFRDNFLKTSFDMVRHSESYVPDIALLNPQCEALEVILDECF